MQAPEAISPRRLRTANSGPDQPACFCLIVAALFPARLVTEETIFAVLGDSEPPRGRPGIVEVFRTALIIHGTALPDVRSLIWT